LFSLKVHVVGMFPGRFFICLTDSVLLLYLFD
jgi:hypothetical protein